MQTHRPELLVPCLALGSGLAPASLTLISPSLPAIETDFQVSPMVLAMAQSGYLVGLAVPQLVFGAFSDRFGRRPPLIVGLMMFLLGSLLCAFAPNFLFLTIGRLLQAIGASAGMMTARALLRDLYPENQAASLMGYLVVAMMVFPMGAPVLGGAIESAAGWEANFLLLAGVSGILLVLYWFAIPEFLIHSPQPREAPIRIYVSLFRSSRFMQYSTLVSLASTANQIFFSCAPFAVASVYSLTPDEYAKYFAIPALGFIIGNFTSARFTKRVGLNTMIWYGRVMLAVFAAAFLAVSYSEFMSPVMLFVMMGFIALGYGFVMPNAMTGATGALEGSFGAAAGLSGFLQMIVAAIGVLIAMPFLTTSILPLVWSVALISLAAFATPVPNARLSDIGDKKHFADTTPSD